MANELDERPIRILVFPDRPDVMLITVPEGQDLWLPRMRSPFVRYEVAKALGNVEVPARVGESVPGRYADALAKMDNEERAEVIQKQKQEEAAKHLATLASPLADALDKQRSELVLEKARVDERIRLLKQKIGKAKSDAFVKGVFLSPGRFRGMEEELATAQAASLAMQGKLRELKQTRHVENEKRNHAASAHFIEAARSMLGKDMFRRIWERSYEMEAALRGSP